MGKNIIAAVSAVSLAAGLGACSSESGETQLESPILVDTDNLHDATIEISQHRPLVVTVGLAEEAAQWTEGSVDDESVARFVPGKDDGSAQFNPGFEAVSAGTTGAQLTDPHSGDVITFTLVVE